MQAPKQLLTYEQQPLIRHTLSTLLATPLRPVVVVLGARAGLIRPVIEDLPLTIQENTDWESGMGGSIAQGLQQLLRVDPDCRAVICCVVDQPHLQTKHLTDLADAYLNGKAELVASEYANGLIGVPALFSRAYFPALQQLAAGQGARDFLRTHREAVATIAFSAGEIDLDTPKDWTDFRGEPRP